MRASHNLETFTVMVGWQADKTQLLFQPQDPFITCLFSSLALKWFPRESHSSEGETAQAGLLDPAQCSSKGSAESFKNSKGKTDLKSTTIYLRKKTWKTKCRTLPSSKVTASKSDLLVQKLNCSQFLFYFWQLKLFCLLPLQKKSVTFN